MFTVQRNDIREIELLRHMRSFLIGETSLLIRCAGILLHHHLPIGGIISTNGRVAAWAKERSIPCLSSGEDRLPFLRQEPFDYLFSIVNGAVLPEEVWRLPAHGAINYHDGPLPRYAGVHATSWALLIRERSHAVSWHMVESRIDAGNILKQWPVTIDEGETALVLMDLQTESNFLSHSEPVLRSHLLLEVKYAPYGERNVKGHTQKGRPLPQSQTRAVHLGAIRRCSRRSQSGDSKSPYPARRSSKNSTPKSSTACSNN
jgi:hypothetical protein